MSRISSKLTLVNPPNSDFYVKPCILCSECVLLQIYLLHQDDEVTVNDVCPLREQTVSGEIIHLAQSYGTIDGDIHFTISACCRGYYPAKGDQVSAICVEYRHRKNNWRAYSVTPIKERLGVKGQGSRFTVTIFCRCCIPSSSSIGGSGSIPKPPIPLLSKDGTIKVNLGPSPSAEGVVTMLPSYDLAPPTNLPSTAPVVLKGTYQEKLGACCLRGQRPLYPGLLKLSKRLKEYPVPEELRECVEDEEGDVMAVEPSLEEASSRVISTQLVSPGGGGGGDFLDSVKLTHGPWGWHACIWLQIK